MTMSNHNIEFSRKQIFIGTLLQNYRIALNATLMNQETTPEDKKKLQSKIERLSRNIQYYHRIDGKVSESLFNWLNRDNKTPNVNIQNYLDELSQKDIEKLIEDIYLFLAEVQEKKEDSLTELIDTCGDLLLFPMFSIGLLMLALSFENLATGAFLLYLVISFALMGVSTPLFILNKYHFFAELINTKYHHDLESPPCSAIDEILKEKIQSQFNKGGIVIDEPSSEGLRSIVYK